MTKPNFNNLNVVRFDDKLVYHASYNLTPRAFKVLCYLISRYIKPDEDKELPTEIIVPAIDILRNVIQGENNSHSVYDELRNSCRELASHIEFPSGIEIDGFKLQGYVSWCSSVVPIKSPNGSIDYRFRFDPLMAHFLLGLTRYVRLYRPEINRLRRSHAIRIFQMLKGIRNRRAKYEVISKEKFEIEHIKFLLKLIEKTPKRKEKYPKVKDFRRWVINPSVEEINEKTTVKILEVNPIREGRKIKYLEFVFTDQQPIEQLPQLPLWGDKYVPSAKELEALTWSQFNAYNDLISFGIEEGIAFKQMLPTIKGSELRGFEDYFIEQALSFFKEKAKLYNPGTFVKWWTDKKIFDSTGDVWGKLLEAVITRKKNLRQNDEKAYDNRMIARDMAKNEFTEWYRKQENVQAVSSKPVKKGFASVRDILDKGYKSR